MKLDTPQPIGPLRCVDVGGNPVLDPTVEISINGGAFVAATGAIVDIGDGFVYYDPDPEDCDELGFAVIRLSGTAVESTHREEIEEAPQGIPVGTDVAAWLHIGPLHAVDSGGTAVTGETFAGAGEIEISLSGAAWTAALGSIVELDGGLYDYIPDPSEVGDVGWAAVKISGVCETFVLRADVVEETVLGGSPVSVPVQPEEVAGVPRLSGDLGLTWNVTLGSADLTRVLDYDVSTDRGLVTAALLSLELDRRAEPDDKPPSGDATDRRGWWADQFAEVEGDLIGSRIWLLDRAVLNRETELRADEYIREALAWMLEDRVIASLSVDIEREKNSAWFKVGLNRPGKDPVFFRFAHTWDHLEVT
jgi:phage gp46-like protein